MKVSKQFRFEASHQISNHPGKCSRLHGHSWLLTVECEGRKNDALGMVVDFYEIKQAVQGIVDALDHQHLGCGNVSIFHKSSDQYDIFLLPHTVRFPTPLQFPELPTSENLLWFIADWIDHIDPLFPWSTLILNETCTSSAELTHTEWDATRKEALDARKATLEEGKDAGKEDAQGRQEAEEVTAALCDVCGKPLQFKRGSTVSKCRHMVKLEGYAPEVYNAPEPTHPKMGTEITDDDIPF